jgi:hypothetical protein
MPGPLANPDLNQIENPPLPKETSSLGSASIENPPLPKETSPRSASIENPPLTKIENPPLPKETSPGSASGNPRLDRASSPVAGSQALNSAIENPPLPPPATAGESGTAAGASLPVGAKLDGSLTNRGLVPGVVPQIDNPELE